ncbi:MAG: helix-hairpin-helix domain-containing protein [bacterium]|nr:helix-hairpin-helix domain-containing protein [bacterium]MDZ4248237.1 helix-hairpin-helix domain-containing protein [Patescibacteria group bacterium]
MERIIALWNRFRIPAVAVAIVATVATGIVSSRLQGQPLVLDATLPSPSPQPTAPLTIVVDIEGAVAKPGVRELPGGSLVADAVKASGGFTQDADRVWVAKDLNQAEELKDHQKLYIPLVGEMVESTSDPAGSNNGGSVGDDGESDGLININTATASELENLPGVGEVTAKKIIDYREAFGPFESAEELMEVSGIGEKTFEKMRDQVTV